ncbi:MAG: putative bifunctional diguanylate cyclase/phosphodiesterase, partial [Solirubrobacteraceae bacterium]
LLGLLLAGAVVWLTSGFDRWSLIALGLITAFAIAGELTTVQTGKLYVSSSFLALILASVLLGPAPAALIGVITITVSWARERWVLARFLRNLTIYAWCPLLGGLFFHLTSSMAHVSSDSPSHYLLVFVTYLLTMMLTFVLALSYGKERTRLAVEIRETLLPVLPAELLTALLTLIGAYGADQLGTAGLVLFGLVLGIFQYLIGQLLVSKRRSEELQRIATTDELTGLANRERFRDAVEQRIAAADSGGRFAIMLMDLDRFKEVNDTLGHHYGDVLLRDLGPRLVAAVGQGGLVARLGGDEFGILPAPQSDDASVLDSITARLIATVSQPFTVDELSLEVGASIGVARYPQDGADSHALLRCADIAMYAAKEAQTGSKVYAAEQNQHSVQRLNVLSDIRHALTGDEIVVHYQPIVDLDDRTVKGAEGLVRWQHPEHGLIPPGAFVQTVEQTGLIGPLTRRVLEHSIAECASWRRDGRALSVAVNLSVRNLLDRDLPREIERMLDSFHVPADALQLEITESMIMTDPDRALATMSRLSDLGVRMSVDDFGTGYSSLANLRRLPIDELKIDRSFVSPMLQDESDLIIVRSTINLAHDLGLRIIAEGVEDAATLERLATLGCDLAQGYHLSRPMAATAFSAWLEESPLVQEPIPADSAENAGGGAAPVDRIGAMKARPAGNLVLARAEH